MEREHIKMLCIEFERPPSNEDGRSDLISADDQEAVGHCSMPCESNQQPEPGLFPMPQAAAPSDDASVPTCVNSRNDPNF